MKIAHINCSDSGSTGKIILDISQESLQRGYKTILCTPSAIANPPIKTYYTSCKYEQGLYRRLCKIGFLQYGFAPLSTWKILRIIQKEQPDVVHLHSINCNMVNIYKLVEYLKKHHIPTVVTNHAEFFYTGSCAHANECNQWISGCKKCDRRYEATGCQVYDLTPKAWQKMYNAFEGFYPIKIVSVSEWVYNRSIHSRILGCLPNMVIKNGVNTNIFKPTEYASILQRYNVPSAKQYILHVTASFSNNINDPKGGRYIIELANAIHDNNIIILVIGSFIDINESQLPSNIKLIGKVINQQELAAFYSLAQITIITSKRETYSMPVAESLCCGTPVVGFYAGGPESIAIKEFTRFVKYGDMNAYIKAVNEFIRVKTQLTATKISEKSIAEYTAEKMAKNYNDLYESLLND